MGKIKKSLQGLKKTNHFLKRQLEREVSDKSILKAFKEGTIKVVEGDYRVTLGTLNIIFSPETSTLITVHPGDVASSKPKLLSKEEASEIKLLIDAQSVSKEDEEDPFLTFVKENSVKKLE